MFSHTEVLRTGLKLGVKQDLGRWKTVSLPSLLKLITQRSSAVEWERFSPSLLSLLQVSEHRRSRRML